MSGPEGRVIQLSHCFDPAMAGSVFVTYHNRVTGAEDKINGRIDLDIIVTQNKKKIRPEVVLKAYDEFLQKNGLPMREELLQRKK